MPDVGHCGGRLAILARSAQVLDESAKKAFVQPDTSMQTGAWLFTLQRDLHNTR